MYKSTYNLIILEIHKRSAFEVLPIIGQSVSAARKIFGRDVYGNNDGRVYADITNYSRWSLSYAHFTVKQGKVYHPLMPSVIRPNFKEAWMAEQASTGTATEGILTFATYPGTYCFVYWVVYQGGQIDQSNSNSLAVGCLPNEIQIADLENLVKQTSADATASELITYKRYARDEPRTQFCNENMCIQGTMTKYSHCSVSISVFPGDETNLAPSLSGKIDQEMIGKVMEEPDLCKLYHRGCLSDSDSGGWSAGEIGGASVGGFFIGLLSLICCCWTINKAKNK